MAQRHAVAAYILILCIATAVAWILLGVANRVIAVTVFIAIVLASAMFWRFRLAFALAGVAVLLVTGLLQILPMVTEYMYFDVILFLMAMMITVHVAKESGLFVWFLGRLASHTDLDAKRVFLILLLSSFVLAATVGEIASVVFVVTFVLEFCAYFELDPLPYVVSSTLVTNLGGSATILGSPIGVLIGMKGGLGFEDFLVWAAPTAILSSIAMAVILFFWYKEPLERDRAKVVAKLSASKDAGIPRTSPKLKMKDVKVSGGILLATIVAIALHGQFELFAGTEEFSYMLLASFCGAAISLLWKRNEARVVVEKGVDWWTLIFFAFLFAATGAFRTTGLAEALGNGLVTLVHSQAQTPSLVLWISSLASSILDNVAVVAASVPVIQNVTASGVNGVPLWLGLLFGGSYGGNITIIGSIPTVVAIGMFEKATSRHVKFGGWLRMGLLGGLLPTVIATFWLAFLFR